MQRKVPSIDSRLATHIVQFVQRVRQLSLRKPQASAKLSTGPGAGGFRRQRAVTRPARETLNILLKDKDDIARTLREAGR